jgi:hypothetical protein
LEVNFVFLPLFFACIAPKKAKKNHWWRCFTTENAIYSHWWQWSKYGLLYVRWEHLRISRSGRGLDFFFSRGPTSNRWYSSNSTGNGREKIKNIIMRVLPERLLQKAKVRWHRTKTLGDTGLVKRFYMAGTETLCGGSHTQRCVVTPRLS